MKKEQYAVNPHVPAVLSGNVSAALRRWVLLCKTYLFGMLILPAITGLATDPYVVTVPEGTTNVVDDAFVAALGAAPTLIKKGPGCLWSNSRMSSYAGGIEVWEGVLYVTEGDSLGTSAGSTVVSNGASIVFNLASQVNYRNEKFILAGDGAPGQSGAFVHQGANMTGAWDRGYRYFTLADDATINSLNGEMGMYEGLLDMGGHTLTIYGRNKNNSGSTSWDYTFGFTRANVTNPGRILFKTGKIVISGKSNDSDIVWAGDENNVLTLSSRTKMSFFNTRTKLPWKLVVEDNTGFFVSSESPDPKNPLGNSWQGPVEIQGATRLSYQANHVGTMWFPGPISGAGSLSWDGYSTVHLAGTNTYAGVTRVNGDVANGENPLYLHDGRSLPRDGGGLTLINGNLPLVAANAYELPVVTFTNRSDRSITGARGGGTMAGLIKTGVGTLDFDAMIDVTGKVELVQGTIRIGVATARQQAGGLMRGEATYDSQSSANSYWYYESTTRDGPAANVWRDSVDLAYMTGYSVWNEKAATVDRYEGYIWNDSNEDVTWSFAAGVSNRSRLWINKTLVLNSTSYQRAAFGQAVLHPGANHFVFTMVVFQTTGGGGGSALTQVIDFDGVTHADPLQDEETQGFKWVLYKGCAYNPNGTRSYDEADYLKFENLADGSLVTVTNDFSHLSSKPKSSFGTFVGEANTVLDAGDSERPIQIGTLSGEGILSNGTFRIGSKWVLRAAKAGTGAVNFRQANLELAEGVALEADDMTALDKSRRVGNPYVIATTDGTFSVLPEVSEEMFGRGWRVGLSADLKAIQLYFVPKGLVVNFR